MVDCTLHYVLRVEGPLLVLANQIDKSFHIQQRRNLIGGL